MELILVSIVVSFCTLALQFSEGLVIELVCASGV